jgi:hypothetical protein
MTALPRFFRRTHAAIVVVLLVASPAMAQSVEIAPFGGYRLGWGVSNVEGAPVVDDDGGVSFGIVANIPIGPPADGFTFEALFSREQARVKVQPTFFSPPVMANVEVDHMMIGVQQELDNSSASRARAFISGLVGLTRYAAGGDTEIRFTIGLGAGGKFFATRHLGLRLEARGYMTIIDLGGRGVCSGGCVFVFNANPVFQADVTAGVIVAF